MNVQPLLTCDGLSVRFGGLTALNRLALEIHAGEILGLIGPNGSGKTTFFNALTGLYMPAEGQVVFRGADITGLPPPAVYRAGITRTFQRSRLCLDLTVFDNLMIGNHRRLNSGLWFNLVQRRRFGMEYDIQVQQARDLVAGFSSALPARLFEPARALGMIDRRRVEICRALISEPALLLLDEPSAGMTHDETRELMNDLLAARRRLGALAIVLIEHEMNVIERVTDRCVVLNYGEKICEGSYATVAADPRVRSAYLGDDR